MCDNGGGYLVFVSTLLHSSGDAIAAFFLSISDAVWYGSVFSSVAMMSTRDTETQCRVVSRRVRWG